MIIYIIFFVLREIVSEIVHLNNNDLFVHVVIFLYERGDLPHWCTLWFQFAKWKGFRKPDFFGNRTCVRFPKQSFANQYWLVYEAITKWKYLVSEGVIDKKKTLLIITIFLHLNNICLREIYITLLEKLLYWVHVYRHFYF